MNVRRGPTHAGLRVALRVCVCLWSPRVAASFSAVRPWCDPGVGIRDASSLCDEADRGDDRSDTFEQQEAPLSADVGVDGEDRSAEEVQEEITACFGREYVCLRKGERGEHEQCAENLDEGTQRDLPLRRPSSGYGAPRPGGAECPPRPR